MAFPGLYDNYDGMEAISKMWVEDKRKLCLILDAGNHWKDLASNRQLHLTQDEVLLLGQSVRAGESPTGGVLHHMNTLGLTMIDLYHHLKRANLPKAMDIVKKYVPDRFHCYGDMSLPLDDNDGTSNPAGMEPAPPPMMPGGGGGGMMSSGPLPLTPNTPHHFYTESPLGQSDISFSSIPELDSRQKRVGNLIMATRSFNYVDIMRATSNLDPQYLIDDHRPEGHQSPVQSEMFRVTLANTTFAAKVFHRDVPRDTLLSDLQDTRNHSHENIVPITGMSTDGDRFVILYEYMRNHSLRYQLDTKAHLSMQTRVYILLDAARGLQYLHDNKPPLIHRNIKSSNILLDNSFRARLSDFGMAIHANKRSSDTEISGYTHYITTQHNSVVQRNRGYCAKEVSSGKYHVKSDTYAFGVVIYEMCTAQLAFDSSRPMRDLELVDFMENNTNNRDNALALQDKSTKWAPAVYVKLLEIAGRCTKDNKRNRPDMKEVYQDLDQLRLEMNNLVDEAENEGQPEDDFNQAEYANMEQLGAQAHWQYPDPQLEYQAALTADQMRYHAGYNRQGVTEQMYLHPKAGDMSAMTETYGAPYSNHSFMSNMERNPIESSHRETSLTDSTLSSLNLSIGPQNQIPLLIPPETTAPTPASLPSGAGDRPTPHVTHQPPQIQPYQENGIPEQTDEFLDPPAPSIDGLETSIISPESINGGRDSPDSNTDESEESDSSSSIDDTEGLSSADTVLDLFSALNCTDAADTADSAADDEETTGGGVDEDYLKQLMSTLNISSSAAAITDPDNTSQNDRQQQHNSLPSMTNGESQQRLTNSVA